MQPDAELLRTFAQLGIEPGPAVLYDEGERPRTEFKDLPDESLLAWLRMLGGETPAKLVAVIRERELLSEAELRQWLESDTGAA